MFHKILRRIPKHVMQDRTGLTAAKLIKRGGDIFRITCRM